MKRFSFLNSADAVTLIFVFMLILVQTFFSDRIGSWISFVPLNISLCAFILFTAEHVHRHNEKSNPVIRLLRDWYLVPCILFIYTQTSWITHLIHQRDYDVILIELDRWIFGSNPTQWISQFAHPFITEILQLAYTSYYLFFIALFFELYRRKNRLEFQSGAFLVTYGFYLSYIGYLVFPAIGPRFTLHDFFATNTELPGIFLTEYLREIVNSGGGIPHGAANPADYVNRDAFPSGHTQLTMVALYVAFTTRANVRWWLLIGGSLLIVSTVYMRYHYVIDVFAGMLFFVFTIWSGKKIDRWWREGIKND